MSLTVVQSSVDKTQLRNIIEAAILAAGRPLDENALMALFGTVDPPPRETLREAISQLQEEYEGRGIQLVKVASGWRVQVTSEMAPALARLWEARPPRFSRALLETLCLIAYRQPITRGEIEDVRGVSVSVNIVRTLLDRHWIRVVGHRDVPGKPEMFGTTREFLDYFGLQGLDDLPTLAELRDFEGPNVELDFEPPIDTQIPLAQADSDAGETSADADGAGEDSEEDADEIADVSATHATAAPDAHADGEVAGDDSAAHVAEVAGDGEVSSSESLDAVQEQDSEEVENAERAQGA